MKQKEVDKLTFEELTENVAQQRLELRRLQRAHAINPLENPMTIRHNRRTIARLNTALSLRKKAELAKNGK